MTGSSNRQTSRLYDSYWQSRIRQAIDSSSPSPPVTGRCAFRFTFEKRLLGNLSGTEWMMHEGPIILLPKEPSGHTFVYAIKCPVRGEILNVTVVCEDRRDQSTSSKWIVTPFLRNPSLISSKSGGLMSLEKQCLRRLAISTKNGNSFLDLLLLSSVSGSSERSNQYRLGLRKKHVLWVTLLMQCFKVWGNPRRRFGSWSQRWIYRLVLGQGAALAFEDAIVLKTLLPFGTPKSEIPEILKRYEMIRKLRIHPIQNLCTEQMLSSSRSYPYTKCESNARIQLCKLTLCFWSDHSARIAIARHGIWYRGRNVSVSFFLRPSE